MLHLKMQARTGFGFTLIEMLASALILGLVGAGICGLLMLNGRSQIKLSNEVDNLIAAQTAIERIGRDVRMARNVGDVYGQIIYNLEPGINGFFGSSQFPSANDPLYGGGESPPNGWPPTAGTSSQPAWPPHPYTLSAQCLIVQVPIFDGQGYPSSLPPNFGNPPSNIYQDNVDTIVYMILPDPDPAWSPPGHPTMMMQVAGFPGHSVPGNTSPIGYSSSPTETLLHGIVGPTAHPGAPMDPATNPPVCFQYLDRTDPSGTPMNGGSTGSPPGATNSNLTGVLVTFEVQNFASGKAQQSTVALKTEVFARNNTMSTVLVNPGSSGS